MGSSCTTPEFSPRETRNSAPFLLRDTAPPVFTSRWMTVASPVFGSIRITLFASLLANSSVPPSPAIGPSALLPCQSHTVFHVWPPAITFGIAVDGGGGGSAGGVAGCGSVEMGMPNGAGLVLHLASTLDSPGFCQACWLLPRGKREEGL